MTKIDPQKMMAQLGQMQKQMEVAQEELKTQYVEHSAGGGVVTVKASGPSRSPRSPSSPRRSIPTMPRCSRIYS